MKKQNEVVTEVQENGYIKRFFLHEIHCSGGGGYRPLSEESNITLFNSSVLLDPTMNDIGSQPVKAPNVSIPLGELLTKLDVTWEQFALVWADIMVPDEVGN